MYATTMTDKDDKEKAARHTRNAQRELEDAKDAVENPAQANHLEDLAEEAEKTADVLEDQAESA